MLRIRRRGPSCDTTCHAAAHRFLTYAQREDGAGKNAVQLGMGGNNVLKVTRDLATFPGRSLQFTAAEATAAEHASLDSSWVIDSRFRLSMQLGARARAEWSSLVAPHWSESTDGCLAPTPCTHHVHNYDSLGALCGCRRGSPRRTYPRRRLSFGGIGRGRSTTGQHHTLS